MQCIIFLKSVARFMSGKSHVAPSMRSSYTDALLREKGAKFVSIHIHTASAPSVFLP